MTKQDIKGMVILLKSDKSLIQTKRIRICQREKLVDKLCILIPFEYEDEDLTNYIVSMQYIGPDTTVRSEALVRMPDGEGGYIDYEDADGNKTHMIYQLPIDSKLTMFAGDVTIKLNLQYTDYEGQTSSDDEDSEATDPEIVYHVLNTLDTIIHVDAVADYYSIVPDETMSQINQKIAELDAKQKELEATAAVYDAEKADDIELDTEDKSLYLTSKGRQIGEKIDLNDLGEALTEDTEAGLIKVIT